MSPLTELLGVDIEIFDVLICFGLILTRIVVIVLLTPFLGGKSVPGRTRMVIALVLSVFIYPVLAPGALEQIPEAKTILIALFFKELFFGFCIGLISIVIFFAIEAAGRIVDQQGGGGNAMLFVPQLGQASIYGVFYFWLAIAFFIAVDGHVLFLEAMYQSFQTVPLMELPRIESLINSDQTSRFFTLIIKLCADVLIIATKLASPVLVAVLLVDIVLGIANKMAPQINVFELGFSLRGYSRPLMVFVSIHILMLQLDGLSDSIVKYVYEMSYLFGL